MESGKETGKKTGIIAALLILTLYTPAVAQSSLTLLGQLNPFPGNNRYGDVWGEGNYAYIGSYNGTGIMIIDISNPASPILVGHYNPPIGGRFQDVVVINGIGYFSSENNGGVHIVDLRDPANPRMLSQITPEKNGYPYVHELFVADGVLYEADSRTNRVKVFDVTTPENPVFVRDIITTDPRFIHAIVVVNNRLYTSGWGGRTDIYDVGSILNEGPRLLGVVETGSSSHSSWVSSDGKLLVSARETLNGDLGLFDVSDPANPRTLTKVTAQSLGINAFSPHNPYIVGNLLFVSWYQAGLVVLDITNPSQPKLAGIYDTHAGEINGFEGCWGVYPFLGLDRVLLSDMDGGLFIVDSTAAIIGPKTVSAASYSVSAIAGRSIVAVFGNNLAPFTEVADTIPLPTSLAGVSVQVQDSAGINRPAPLFLVTPGQINYQIPYGTAPGPATIYLTSSGGPTQTGVIIVTRSAPSLFTKDQSGRGEVVAIDAFTFAGSPFNAQGQDGGPNVIAMFGTGLGEDATDVDNNVSASVQIKIDGQPVPVLYAGPAPGLIGLNQFNLMLPQGITSGAHELVVSRNGVTSNVVAITIR
jgi:uncharacterized protein (TIGR03437 family)